jgi:hypothetical protein
VILLPTLMNSVLITLSYVTFGCSENYYTVMIESVDDNYL